MRVDYWRDPNAPAANSLVVAASAVVVDGVGRILLQRRVDNELWALPGGGMELGESIRQTAVREVREETGLNVVVEHVIGVYSDPAHVFEYDDGEVRQEFSVCVKCRVVGGVLRVSDESYEVGWFDLKAIADLVMHPRIRARIDDYAAGKVAELNP
jgi:8-oxo-dGTP pyrophosphatase MutT (NUDIX family)